MRITIYIIGTCLVAWFFAQFIYILMECKPVSAFWDYKIVGKCNTDKNITGYSINGASLVLDLIIFVVPMPPLWNLKRGLVDRICLMVIFSFGAL